MRVLLVSTYDLGRQPFGLASPTAWLRDAGHEVACIDLAVEPLSRALESQAPCDGIALYLPMHTATRLAAKIVPQLRKAHPHARFCAYGLYAPLNAHHLHDELGIDTVLGPECEADLVAWAAGGSSPVATAGIPRLAFRTPDRTALPVLSSYPGLRAGAELRRVGVTESTRGCKHLCRHCPVVPVYQGQFRVVPVDIVMADVRQQVAAGAEHITFSDPDFFNGPTHARRLLELFHAEFPAITFDATIKIEHLRRHRELLPVLRAAGCLFVTTAVESLDDHVLELLEKGHTRADFFTTLADCRAAGLTLSPTFIPFTPWTTRESYLDLLETLDREGFAGHINPIQLALRLLIPAGSRLLELPDIQSAIETYDSAALLYRWRHPNPAIDTLAKKAMRVVSRQIPRAQKFAALWQLAAAGTPYTPAPQPDRATIPYLEEPWYC